MAYRRIGLVSRLDGVNDAALRYLILQLNTVQSSFEFEFLSPPPEDPFLRNLAGGTTCDRVAVREDCAHFKNRLIAYTCGQGSLFGAEEPPPENIVVLTGARFNDNFYSLRSSGVSVIALGNWKRWMAPPSVLEFALTLTIREAITTVSPVGSGAVLRRSVHLGTKGCPCDFTESLSDARQKVLSSFLCAFCKKAIRDAGAGEVIPDIEAMLAKSWLGPADDPSSPAGVVSALGHDLFIVKGLRPTAWELIRIALRREGAQQFLGLVQTVTAAVLISALVLVLGLK